MTRVIRRTYRRRECLRHQGRGTWFVALTMLALALGACERAEPNGREREKPDRPNVLLITVESLRSDHVSCYGYERATTPNLDALAATATRYTQAFAATSWTLTSHASIFTGLYPSVHKVILPQDRLADGYTTAAEVLESSGYQTASVVGGPYLRSTFNLTQGFGYRDESAASDTNEAAHKDITNPRMAEAMERFLRTKRDAKRPFFLFAYYWDVHYDYIPPPPYNTMFVPEGAEPIEEVQFGPITVLGEDISQPQLEYLVAQYDGEIGCTDAYLGKLWALLRELDLWDDTAIIVTADHGEQFFEHSYLGHKLDLYAESLHVPLIVKYPHQDVGRVEDRIVSLVDLFPTILDLAECDPPNVQNGRSLLAEGSGGDRSVFFELTTTWDIRNRETGEVHHDSDRWVAVRNGRCKLLHVEGTGFWQLFDAVADPLEQSPLGAEWNDLALRMKEQIETWRAAMTSLSTLWEAGPKAQLSERELDRLRSLGYVP